MANFYDKQDKILLLSRNTPDYRKGGKDYVADRYIENPAYVPDCESKYVFIELDDKLREMTQAEKAVVDYVAPPVLPTLAEAKVSRQTKIKQECRTHIYSAYSVETQLNAGNGIYSVAFKIAMTDFIVASTREERRCYDAIGLSMTVEEVALVTPIFPAVI